MAHRPTSGHPLPPLVLAAALVLAGGCSGKTGRITGPGGDTGGRHLVVYATDRLTAPGEFQLVLYDLDAAGFRVMRHINFTTRPEVNPAISADGLLIAFQSDTGGHGNDDVYIYSRALDRLVDTPGLNTDSSETGARFTADVQHLLFVRKWNGYRHIRLYDPTLDLVRAPSGLDTSAAYNDWTPAPDRTGARFAFVSDRSGNPDVYVCNSGALLDIPDLRSAGNDIEPSLTPDGRYLCFASDRAGGQGGYDLYLYDLNTRAFVPLATAVNTAADERHPSIGAGASVISFQSDRGTGLGKWDVWNYSRPSALVGQGLGQSSAGDDMDPSLFWP